MLAGGIFSNRNKKTDLCFFNYLRFLFHFPFSTFFCCSVFLPHCLSFTLFYLSLFLLPGLLVIFKWSVLINYLLNKILYFCSLRNSLSEIFCIQDTNIPNYENVRAKTIKSFLKNIIEEKFHDWFSNDLLTMTQKQSQQKKKTDKWDFIKIKNGLCIKGSYQQSEKAAHGIGRKYL